MIKVDQIKDAHKRMRPYVIKTPTLISERLNKKFGASLFFGLGDAIGIRLQGVYELDSRLILMVPLL